RPAKKGMVTAIERREMAYQHLLMKLRAASHDCRDHGNPEASPHVTSQVHETRAGSSFFPGNEIEGGRINGHDQQRFPHRLPHASLGGGAEINPEVEMGHPEQG